MYNMPTLPDRWPSEPNTASPSPLYWRFVASSPTTAAVTSQALPTRSGRIEANGVHYYYEIHGQGEPLLLLHGGLGSIDMFRPVLPVLAEGRQVVAVDLHGHGRTPLSAIERST